MLGNLEGKSFLGGAKKKDLDAAKTQNEELDKRQNKTIVEAIIERIKGEGIREITGADYRIRCSSIGAIMTNPTGKSPMQKWVEGEEKLEKLLANLEDRKARYQKLINDNIEKQQGAFEKIEEYNNKLEGANMELAGNKKIEQTRNKRQDYIENLEEKKKEIEADWSQKKFELHTEIKAQRAEQKTAHGVKDKIHLSQGCITEIKKWMKQRMFRRRRELDTKHTIKGKEMEDEAIGMYHRVCGFEGVKNEVRLNSDWMTGEFDDMPKDKDGLILNIVADNKCSWDIETFPYYKDVPPSNQKTPKQGYWAQLQGYFHLVVENKVVTDIEALTGELVYTLQSSSHEQMEKEIKRRCYAKGVERLDPEEEETIVRNMWFDEIPEAMRVKRYIFKPDWEYIEEIKERVLLIRRYIDEEILAKHSMIIEIKD